MSSSKDTPNFLSVVFDRLKRLSEVKPAENQLKFKLEVLKDARVMLRFDKPTDFTKDIKNLINISRTTKYPILSLSLISSDGDLVNSNLDDWVVSRVTPNEIEIKLTYKDP